MGHPGERAVFDDYVPHSGTPDSVVDVLDVPLAGCSVDDQGWLLCVDDLPEFGGEDLLFAPR